MLILMGGRRRTKRDMILFRSARISFIDRPGSSTPCTIRSGELVSKARRPISHTGVNVLGLDDRPCSRLTDDMRQVRAEAHRSHRREVRCAGIARVHQSKSDSSSEMPAYSPEPPRTPIRPGSFISSNQDEGRKEDQPAWPLCSFGERGGIICPMTDMRWVCCFDAMAFMNFEVGLVNVC